MSLKIKRERKRKGGYISWWQWIVNFIQPASCSEDSSLWRKSIRQVSGINI